jgi:RiboL-PSP-HEPN
MPSPLDELAAQIEELKSDVDFIGLATQLRPRLGSVVQWDAHSEAVELVRRFVKAKANRPEGMFGPLLIRLLAAFERYLRQLVEYVIEERASMAVKYEDLAPNLANRNLVLTGRLLSGLEVRDHITIDVDLLIENLASCRRGSNKFRLNPQAFCAGITGVSPANIEKALENVAVNGWWDAVGNHNALSKVLGTKGARATGDRAHERLKELSRWRNHLAHGGDGGIAVSETQLLDAIAFVDTFGAALDVAVRNQLRR